MAQTKVNAEQDNDKLQVSCKTPAGKMKPSYKHIPHSQKPPHLVAKRNARERRRVQAVNQAFYKLRKSVPIENRNKRVSKVKTLQRAIDYIRKLEMILAEDEAQGGSGADKASDASLPQRASAKLDGPLQQKTSEINSSSYNQDGGSATRNNQPLVATRDESQVDSDLAGKELRAKQRPKRFEFGLDEITTVKKQQRIVAASTTQKQRRGRKPNGSRQQLTGDLHQAGQQANHRQLARDARVQCAQNGFETSQDDNDYDPLKSDSTGNSDGTTTAATTITSAPTTTTNLYLPTSNGSGGPVSYGRPRDSTPSLVTASSGHHYPSHHYQYYADSPSNEQQHIGYIPHLQLPLDAQQQQQQQGGEISSSATANSFCGYTQAPSYHYNSVVNSNCGPLLLDPARVASNQQHRLINHDSFLAPFDTVSTSGQHNYPATGARHHQTSAWPSPNQQAAAIPNELERGKLTSQHLQNKPPSKTTRIETQFAPRRQPTGPHHKQGDYEEKPAAAQSMPADSTSSSGMLRGQHHLSQSKPPLSIGSPPVSICSSSSLSPSTTLKSLDLSGGSSGGSSTSSAMFNAINSNRSDKSPTTTTSSVSAIGTPVVCRQQNGGGGGSNNSNHDGGAHSTTARDYLEQSQTNRQQQVNNYANQPYMAHFSYETPSNGVSDYHRLEGPQRQPDGQQAIKSIGGVQNKSQTPSVGAASLHAATNTAAANSELRYQNGSRSSSAISPPQAQLPLVAGNYLANNNLHGNNQHPVQLFHQQQPTYYQQQQQQLHHQHQHHHHHHHHQQSLYQGQHFLSNQPGLQQQQQQHHHNSNHLSDHHSHHLQSESSSSSELRQQNANTIELITATNIIGHQQSSSDQLVVNSSGAANPAPTQYTVLPL